MLSTTFVAFWFMAAPLSGAADCAPDSTGYCTAKVVRYSLSNAQRDPVISVNVALGKSLIIEYGAHVEPAHDPVLGNKMVFSTEYLPNEHRLLLWASAPKADGVGNLTEADLLGQHSNLQIDLLGSISVLVELRIGDERQAVERLVLDFPERQNDSEFLNQKMIEKEAELIRRYDAKEKAQDANAVAMARDMVAQGILKRHQCKELSGRTMTSLVVLRSHRICRIGDSVYLSFSLKNRSRVPFFLAEMKVQSMPGHSDLTASLNYSLGSVMLGFDGEVQGIASMELADNERNGANRYALVATESGAQGRTITLDDVGF